MSESIVQRKPARTPVMAVCALVGLVISGCGSAGSVERQTVDPREELLQRPTYAQAGADYKALLEEAVAAVAELDPGVVWSEKKPFLAAESLCSEPYSSVDDARHHIYDTGDGTGRLSDDRWPEIQKKVKAVAAEYGFTEVALENHDPGKNLVLVLAGKYDDTLELISGSAKTGLTVYGGCFLTSGETSSPS